MDFRRKQALTRLSTMLASAAVAVAMAPALAADIDPTYPRAFARARAAGVEAIAWRCAITADGIDCAGAVPIEPTVVPVEVPAPRARLRAAGRGA